MLSGNERGGIERIVFPLVEALRQRGWTVDLAILRPGSLSQDAVANGLKPVLFARRSKLNIMMLWRLMSLIKRRDYDLVHTHSIGGNFYGRLAGRLARIPVVTTVHADTRATMNDAYAKRRWLSDFYSGLDLWMARLSSRLVVFSSFLARSLRTRGISESKVSIVRGGLGLGRMGDASRVRGEFDVTGKESIITTVGRLVATKNQGLFLRAARCVLERRPDCLFLIVGLGPLEVELKKTAEELGLSEKVHFLGWREDVEDVLAASDVFVVSSNSEGLSLVTIEAMAQGKPVVATHVGALDELVEAERTGILVPANDERSLGLAILRLLNNPEERREMGAAARARVERDFTIGGMVEDTELLYREVLPANISGPRSREIFEREEENLA